MVGGMSLEGLGLVGEGMAACEDRVGRRDQE